MFCYLSYLPTCRRGAQFMKCLMAALQGWNAGVEINQLSIIVDADSEWMNIICCSLVFPDIRAWLQVMESSIFKLSDSMACTLWARYFLMTTKKWVQIYRFFFFNKNFVNHTNWNSCIYFWSLATLWNLFCVMIVWREWFW